MNTVTALNSQEAEAAYDEYKRTLDRILKGGRSLSGRKDLFIVYSEVDDILVVAGIDKQSSSGFYTAVTITPSGIEQHPFWVLSPFVVISLRGYLNDFVSGIKKRIRDAKEKVEAWRHQKD